MHGTIPLTNEFVRVEVLPVIFTGVGILKQDKIDNVTPY
jgi:hypothetical protein